MLCTYSLEHPGLCTVLQAFTTSAYFWPLAREIVRWQKFYILPWSKISTTPPSDLILQPTKTGGAIGTYSSCNWNQCWKNIYVLHLMEENTNSVKYHHKPWHSNTASSLLGFLALQHTTNTYFITPTSCAGLTWCWHPVCLRNKLRAEGPELGNLTFPSWLTVLFQLTCANRKDEQRPKAHPICSPSPWPSVW